MSEFEFDEERVLAEARETAGLDDFGDPDLLSHTLLHAYPQHVALQYEIPLVLLGENAAVEYSGETDTAASNTMTPVAIAL